MEVHDAVRTAENGREVAGGAGVDAVDLHPVPEHPPGRVRVAAEGDGRMPRLVQELDEPPTDESRGPRDGNAHGPAPRAGLGPVPRYGRGRGGFQYLPGYHGRSPFGDDPVRTLALCLLLVPALLLALPAPLHAGDDEDSTARLERRVEMLLDLVADLHAEVLALRERVAKLEAEGFAGDTTSMIQAAAMVCRYEELGRCWLGDVERYHMVRRTVTEIDAAHAAMTAESGAGGES